MQQQSMESQDAEEEADLFAEHQARELIQRRRRLFSHQRQYEAWRKKQFSFDSNYYYRPVISAAKRRRQYHRQFSCRERSESSRDSRDSKYRSSVERNSESSLDDAESVNSHRKITLGYVELLQKIQDDLCDEMNVSESCECECEGSEVGSLINPQTKLRHFHYLDEPSTTISERCTRNRINSAIFVSSEGRGFDSIEFLRRHGSQSVLCRKARSAENISDDDRKRRFSDNQRWGTEDSSHLSETIELVECHTTPSIKPIAVAAPKCTATPSKMVATASAIATAINKANSIVGSISIETPPSDIQSVHQQPLQPQAHVLNHPQPQPPQHQNTMSSTTSQNQISASANNSPVRLTLKAARPPVTNLPTLSISQPSPPAEGEFL